MPSVTFTRTLLLDPQVAHRQLVDGLPTIKDVTVTDPGNPIQVERKRNIRANRWASKAQILVDGDTVEITVDGLGSQHAKFSAEMLELLPEGAVYDHDLPAAKERMGKSGRWFASLELHQLIDDLRPRERVISLDSCQVDGELALLVVTDRRILAKNRKAFESSAREISPKSISSIESGSKITGDWLKLSVSNSSIEVSVLNAGRGKELANTIHTLMEEPTQPTPAPSSSGIGNLEKLAELHASGVLTDEEFSAAKAKALGL